MSTKKKLAKTEYGPKAFEALYQEEIQEIEQRRKDLVHFDELDADAARELELDARSYYRKFARIFFDASDGRVSEDDAIPLWERYEELVEEFQQIQKLEEEKEKIEHDIHIQDLEEQELNQKIEIYHEKMLNQRVLFLSTTAILFLAVALTVFIIWQYKILLSTILWPAIGVVLIAVFGVFYFYKTHKKAKEKEKLYGTVRTNKRIVSNRLQMKYESQTRKLGYYYEKYDTIFSYITAKQWKLFGFCAKVFEVLDSKEELQEERDKFIDALKNHGFLYPETWCYYVRALYDTKKREQLVAQWDKRIQSCRQGIEKYKERE